MDGYDFLRLDTELYEPEFTKFCGCASAGKRAYSEQKHRRSIMDMNIPTTFTPTLTRYLKSL